MQKINIISICSVIENPAVRTRVQSLMLEYRKQLMQDIIGDVWELRERKFKHEPSKYTAMNDVIRIVENYK